MTQEKKQAVMYALGDQSLESSAEDDTGVIKLFDCGRCGRLEVTPAIASEIARMLNLIGVIAESHDKGNSA